jgi:hypothetical protein
VDVEGKAGTSGIIDVWTPKLTIQKAENADLLDQNINISRYNVNFENSGSKYTTKTVTFYTEYR